MLGVKVGPREGNDRVSTLPASVWARCGASGCQSQCSGVAGSHAPTAVAVRVERVARGRKAIWPPPTTGSIFVPDV
jgi:hypothetical protein